MKSRTKGILGVVAILVVVLMVLWLESITRFLAFHPTPYPPSPVAEVRSSVITQSVGRALLALPMESGTGQPLMLPSERMTLETGADSVEFLLNIEIPEATSKEGYRLELLVEAYHGVRILPPVLKPEGMRTQLIPLPLRFVEEGAIESAGWDSYVFDFGPREIPSHHIWDFWLVVPPRHKLQVTAVTYPSEERTKSRDARVN